jgi:hypothetical protein
MPFMARTLTLLVCGRDCTFWEELPYGQKARHGSILLKNSLEAARELKQKPQEGTAARKANGCKGN